MGFDIWNLLRQLQKSGKGEVLYEIMRRTIIKNELLIINILTILLIVIITFLELSILRIILGLPFVLFFPGYVLVAALFPRKGNIEGIERVALSFGLSIAVVPLIGLILNYTPWGIRLEPILYSVASFIFIMSVIAWLRRKRLPREERFGIEFHLALPAWGGTTWDKALSIILVLAIGGALGTLGYVIATPRVGERFTEFYILGLDGKAEDYPRELKVGEEGRVIVGVINREHETVSYRVEVRIEGVISDEVGPIVLEHDERWREIVSFTPHRAGNQTAKFLLYKIGEVAPYRGLHLWLDVTEG
jgi:uncharacterized membrane protein